MKLYTVTDKHPMLLFSISVLTCHILVLPTWILGESVPKQSYQLVLNMRVDHDRVSIKGDERRGV